MCISDNMIHKEIISLEQLRGHNVPRTFPCVTIPSLHSAALPAARMIFIEVLQPGGKTAFSVLSMSSEFTKSPHEEAQERLEEANSRFTLEYHS